MSQVGPKVRSSRRVSELVKLIYSLHQDGYHVDAQNKYHCPSPCILSSHDFFASRQKFQGTILILIDAYKRVLVVE
jgi:hypothetical protein